MYTLEEGTEITVDILKDIFEYIEYRNKRIKKLKRYYKSNHCILEREKDGTRANNRIVTNHAKFITDTAVGYSLGDPISYASDEDIDKIIDEYKAQSIKRLDKSIGKMISKCGIGYEYIYSDNESNPRSVKIDPTRAIIVYDDTIEHKKLYGVFFTVKKINRDIEYRFTVLDDVSVKTYTCGGTFKSLFLESEIDHYFGSIPLIEWKNNDEQEGDYECVLTLIDAYNTLQSDRVNDKEQLVDAILLFYGMDISEEQAEALKTSRMLSQIPSDARAEYLIKVLNEGEVEILRNSIKEDIHKISKVPDMSDQNFVGNASGVALKYKLIGFEQLAKEKEDYFEEGLKERLKLYNSFLNTKYTMPIINTKDVKIIFTRSLPSNDFEMSQTINNLSSFVDKETLISQLSFVEDPKAIVEKVNEENKSEYSYDIDKTNEIGAQEALE